MRARAGAVIVLAVVVALAIWLTQRNSSSKSTATLETPATLTALAQSLGQPIFWVGPKAGYTYELTRTSTGNLLVRYLPPGVKLGDKGAYMTVGTYPYASAVAAVTAISKRPGATPVAIPGGAVGAVDPAHPTSVYAAYQGSNFEIELFDPHPAEGLRYIASGALAPIGNVAAPTTVTTKLNSAAGLRAVAAAQGHSVYWAGAQANTSYETAVWSDGRVYIRYLPKGANAGAKDVVLTIATYSVKNAAAAVRRIAASGNSKVINVPGGAIAAVDPAHPRSVYVAYPGSDYEIEVFDPSSARSRQLVTSGSITPIG